MMRISSIELWHVRGIEHLALRDIPATGVSVIHGPNEEGKSTIIAAVLMALNYKHSSKASDVQSLASEGQVEGPRVKITGTIGAEPFGIDKQWLRKSFAQVSVGTTSRSGEEAEQLLSTRIKEAIDMDLLTAVMSQQGGTKAAVDAATIPTLSRALHAASDGDHDLDVSGDSSVIDLAETEYSRYFTATGRAKGELAAAQENLSRAEAEAHQAAEEARALEAVVEEVMVLHGRLVDAEEALPGFRADHAASVAEYRVVEELLMKEKELVSSEQRQRVQVEVARLEHEGALKPLHDLERAETVLAQLQEEEPVLRAAAEEEERQGAAALQDYEEAVAVETAAKQQLAQATQLRASCEEHARREQLCRLVEQLDDLDEQIARHGEVTQVSEADMDAATTAAREIAVARAAMEAAAATVTLAAPEGSTVVVNGEDVNLQLEGQRWSAVEDLHLVVGEVDIHIAPAGSHSSFREDIQRHMGVLEEIVHRYGCGDVDALRQVHQHGVVAAERIRHLRSLRSTTLGEHIEAELRREAHEIPGANTSAVTLAEAHAQEEAAHQQLAAAQDRRAQAQEVLLAGQRTIHAAQYQRHQDKQQLAAEEVTRLCAETKAKGEDAVTQLAEGLEHARIIWERTVSDLGIIRDQIAENDAEAKRSRVESLAAKVENTTKTIGALKEKIAAKKSAIDMATGAGQRHSEAQQALEQTRRGYAAVERRATAARLLREALRTAHENTVARYAAPYVEQLGAIARVVFGPTAHLEVDSSLAVTARELNGVRLPIKALSAGAQEQVALMTRLAMARLVTSNDQGGVPVFLDDILSVSDAGRVDAIAAVLNSLSAHEQILVFTCVPERMAGVTGVTEYAMADLKS